MDEDGIDVKETWKRSKKTCFRFPLDFMGKSVKSGKPFFLWHNTTRMACLDTTQPTGGEKRVGIVLYFRERDGTRDGTEL
jgi:hypothetical protein